MKMKTSEAIMLANAIAMVQNIGKFAPPKFGFALAINATALKPIAEAFEASRISLLKEHAVKDAEGEPVMISENGTQRFDLGGNESAFTDALKSVQDTEVEFAVMEISLDDFPKEIEPGLVMGLLPIISAPAAKAA